MWRGSLLPPGCEAAPVYECFALKREQAPSPQKGSLRQKNTRTLAGIFHGRSAYFEVSTE
ncbi:hypothetical protein EMIT0P100_10781 [Pseudomonas sp. IT-P100]